MINYLDTKNEIEILKLRIDCLKSEREELSSLVDVKSQKFDKISVQETKIPDKKIVEYVYKISILDEKIKKKMERLKLLEEKLTEMEEFLKSSVGIKQKILKMRFIDGLKAEQIAMKIGYSVRSIYRILETVGTD